MPKVNLVSEKQFRQTIVDLCKLYGWKYYFTWNSKNSPAGFPDLVLVRNDRIIFAELKSEKGKLTEVQEEWLEALSFCGDKHEVYVWRPSNAEKIAEILR